METLFGRGSELEAIVSFLDGLPEGVAALFLEGGAGSGKTCVWKAGLDLAHERSYPVLSCRAIESKA